MQLSNDNTSLCVYFVIDLFHTQMEKKKYIEEKLQTTVNCTLWIYC